MTIELMQLEEVQHLDMKVQALMKTRANLLAQTDQAQQRVETQAKALDARKTELRSVTVERMEKESEYNAEGEKIRRWEHRLLEIKTNREYQALLREIDMSKRANEHLETDVLELMGRLEGLERDVHVAEELLRKLETERDAARKTAEEHVSTLEDQARSLDEKRADLVSKIPEPLLRRYETIRDRRGGIALVATVDGRCHGCNIQLPPQLFVRLQVRDTVESCPACNRILFFRPQDAATPQQQIET